MNKATSKGKQSREQQLNFLQQFLIPRIPSKCPFLDTVVRNDLLDLQFSHDGNRETPKEEICQLLGKV